MTRRLRSNFPRGSYLWAVRNAQWQALGIPEEDCEKPKIAIVNSSSELAACFSHLDGMVCLTSCDKTVPGQLMAAGCLNIPTLMLACGYQPSGEYKGEHVDIEDVFVGAMHAQMGQLPMEDLIGMSRQAIRGPGVCSGMGTANTMHIVCGGPGMGGGSSKVVFAIDGAGLGEQVALITDGHLSGLVCKGLVVAEVSPEGAVCGPLALVQDGDTISIDLDRRRCDLEVDAAELEQRKLRWKPVPKQFDTGWLQIYRRNVSSLAAGAVLIDTQRE